MKADQSETILDDSEMVMGGSTTGPPSSEGDHQSFATCPSGSIYNHSQRAFEELVSTASDLHDPGFTPFEHQGDPRKRLVTQTLGRSKHKTSSHHSDSTPTEGNLSATKTAHLPFSSQNSNSQDRLTSTCFQTLYGTNCTNSYHNKPQELFGEQAPQCPATCGITEFGVKVHRESSEMFSCELNQEEKPLNFSKCWKWFITISVSFLCFTVTLGTAIVTADVVTPARELKMSMFTSGLAMSLFVIGLGIGPLIYAPISEYYGRKRVYVLSMAVYTLCTIPSALATCPEVLLIARAFAGLFGGAPLTNVGGSIADIWELDSRGLPMAILTYFTFAGPVLGPLIGTYVADLWGWRAAYWTLVAFSAASVMMALVVPETLSLVLIRKKTDRQKPREILTENGAVEFKDPFARPRSHWELFWPQLKLAIVKPFKMLSTEPILVCMTAYLSLITVILYYYFFAYPLIFQNVYGYGHRKVALMFIPIFVGVLPAIGMTPLWDRFFRQMVERGPEARLMPMIFCAIILPVSIFTFAWTSSERLGVLGPSISGVLFGFCVTSIWTSANAYLVDSFPGAVASAIAGATFVRCLSGATVPMWVFSLLDSTGPRWASSILGFITVLMIPIPLIFFRWGEKFRNKL